MHTGGDSYLVQVAEGLFELLQEQAVHAVGQLALSVGEACPLEQPEEAAGHIRASIRQAQPRGVHTPTHYISRPLTTRKNSLVRVNKNHITTCYRTLPAKIVHPMQETKNPCKKSHDTGQGKKKKIYAASTETGKGQSLGLGTNCNCTVQRPSVNAVANA